MGRSPSFSQPRPAMNTARTQGNSGAAAGGAAYANRNQTAAHPAGAAAAGAGYADHNQTAAHPAGAAAAGAGYANRNQSAAHPAGAAAAGAGYANRNEYDQYHPGMTNGYWNGNYGYGGWGMGAGLMAGVGMWGMGSAVRLRLLGVQQPLLWRRCGAGRPLCTIGGGSRLRLLSTDQHTGGAARADHDRPGDRGLRPGSRGLQVE